MNPLNISRLANRRAAVVIGTVAVGLTALVLFLEARVPRHITFYAGAPGSTHYTGAEVYRDLLRPHGITVDIVETAGSIESLELLAAENAPRNAVTMAQAGIEALVQEETDLSELVSLGTLYVEPFWLFAHVEEDIDEERDLVGRLVVPGAEGSAVRVVTESLLEQNGIERSVIDAWLGELPADEVYEALRDNEADAAFMIGLPNTPLIEELLRADFARPVTFRRAEAYERNANSITTVTLPEGAFDLAANIPQEDLTLLAAVTQLVVREDMSGVMVDLLLDVATTVHRESTLFHRRGVFPSPEHVSFPVDPAAERYYAEGPSTLRRVAPFWVATVLDRTALVLAALITASVALLQIVPALLRMPFQITRRQFVRTLARIERDIGAGRNLDELEQELHELADAARELSVPKMMAAEYGELCQLIFDATERLGAARERSAAS